MKQIKSSIVLKSYQIVDKHLVINIYNHFVYKIDKQEKIDSE